MHAINWSSSIYTESGWILKVQTKIAVQNTSVGLLWHAQLLLILGGEGEGIVKSISELSSNDQKVYEWWMKHQTLFPQFVITLYYDI